MPVIDLDAARAARAEAQREPNSFIFGGQSFDLPVELPAEFAFLLAVDGDTRKAMQYLLEGEWQRFWDLRPSIQDIEELARGIASAYGFGGGMGESSASPDSSLNGGSRSRPTSPTTTASTSERRAGARSH